MAKSKPFDMGVYTPTEEDVDAFIWCIRNKIYISPKAINESRWTITINNKNITNEDPNSYMKTIIWEKVFEYYKYYYNKYENKI